MNTTIPRSERLIFFSDGVFAIIMTILVLDLRPPHGADWRALLSLWPSAVSYAVSYVFLAIVWLNHHHLLRFAPAATSRLIWGNFAHLFTISLVPFTTAWIAESRLGAVPVALYALVFFLVNATYMLLCTEAVDKTDVEVVTERVRRTMRIRCLTTMGVFLGAALVALIYPIGGLVLICICLILYLRPEAGAPEAGKQHPTAPR
jgi:uncharacterized membrane protein